MLEVEERVNHLDELMAQLIQTVDRTSKELREFKQEMRISHERFEHEMRMAQEYSERERQASGERSEREMREFKEEMRLSDERSKREMQAFKEEMRLSHERSEREMREFKEEMRLSREHSERETQASREHSEREMREFKEEMRLSHERSDERSKREMQEFKEEMRQSRRDLDKKWGELSNKLGTMAEDLVAPSVPRILKQITGCTAEIEQSAVRVRKSKPRLQEFDVVAVCEDYVLINETKSTLRSEYITRFYELMQEIHEFFPEFAGKQFIGAIASLYVDETLVRYGEKLGLVVLGFGEELMDVLNSPGFVPKRF